MLFFANDYGTGAHPRVLERLVQTNLEPQPGYGEDAYSAAAREKLRAACGCPGAAVYFLMGGTQANAVVLGALLRPWQGVIAAETGHISAHEAGAIERGGHKVLSLPHRFGKLSAADIGAFCARWQGDENREHMVMPGLVYLSQPTEYGTLYSLAELTAIRAVCDAYGLALYLDGARLACALGSPENDAALPDLARLCDAFYVGGTKCGALCGEAVIFPAPETAPRFFTQMKQQGALLAKGRLPGAQFDALFTDGLYEALGRHAVEMAAAMKEVLREKGVEFFLETPTNQQFLLFPDAALPALRERVAYSFWEKADGGNTVVRFCTSWSTAPEDVEALRRVL